MHCCPHSEVLKTRFQTHPPHTVAEAAYEIEKLTGIQLALSACRDFMHKHLGMKYRKMAVIPSKADPDKQSEFLHNKLEPLLEEEKQGKRRVFFVDAVHFVMGAFLGMLWCFERLFLKSSSGRNRYNVLGAYSVKDSEWITNDAYINSDTLGSVDISKIGVLKQSLTIARVNCNPLIQQAFLPNVNRP